jgi:hypothetical protein
MDPINLLYVTPVVYIIAEILYIMNYDRFTFNYDREFYLFIAENIFILLLSIWFSTLLILIFEWIYNNPITTVLIILGIGALIAVKYIIWSKWIK